MPEIVKGFVLRKFRGAPVKKKTPCMFNNMNRLNVKKLDGVGPVDNRPSTD